MLTVTLTKNVLSTLSEQNICRVIIILPSKASEDKSVIGTQYVRIYSSPILVSITEPKVFVKLFFSLYFSK